MAQRDTDLLTSTIQDAHVANCKTSNRVRKNEPFNRWRLVTNLAHLTWSRLGQPIQHGNMVVTLTLSSSCLQSQAHQWR